jgi:hypothetical protein
MIDEKTAPYPGSRMDFNTCNEPRELRKLARQAMPFLLPEPMAQAVGPKGVQAGVTEQTLTT